MPNRVRGDRVKLAQRSCVGHAFRSLFIVGETAGKKS